jgi:hypothetical protein
MTLAIYKNWENRDKDSIILKMINCIIADWEEDLKAVQSIAITIPLHPSTMNIIPILNVMLAN